jgi:SAM-dependent methyltransferase/GNAT superfamily N-acetyltransferase
MSAPFAQVALGDAGLLRELTEADRDALQALYERCADHFLLHEGRAAHPTEARDDWDDVPDGTPRSHKHVVGLLAPGLAGVAEVVRDWPRPRTWIIGLMLLEPAARGRATGTLIVAAIDEWAARAGADTLRVAVKPVNTGGMAFWRRLGFEPVPAVGADPAVLAFERPVTRPGAAMADRYDAIRYPGHAFAQTHPDRVAALATLFGIDAVAPAGCRLLEIGCGDGGNLLGMALALPGASFAGFDLSGRAIDLARARADELGLDNVRFEEVGIEEFGAPAGSFDYVVAHGVFSWVPDPVREQLLALCGHVLSANGVAFVSYNAQPGYRLRQALRELLALELEGVEDPRRRIAGARRVLARLSGENEPATAIGAEAAALAERSDALLFHDALAEVNDAFLVTDFAARAARHGLQYLAEADLRDLRTDVLPAAVRDELPGTDDLLRREQILDYLKLRRFRQTLLCRAAVALERAPVAARIAPLAAASPARAIVADDERPGLVTFEAPGGASITSDDERVVAALVRLGHAWPAAVSVEDLLGEAGGQAPAAAGDDATGRQAQARAALYDALLDGALRGVVWLHAHPPAVSSRPGERPRASALARLQARDGEPVATLRHATIRVTDELDRRVLALLDGTRDRAALLAQLPGAGGPGGDALAERVELVLERIARTALLTA